MPAAILTIGYEGAGLDDVLAALDEAGARTLIDVREAPVSRKPGFSKGALGRAMEEAGIAYVHLRALSTPKVGRDAARAGRHREFEDIYARRLSTPEAEAALAAALMARDEGPACLLYFERESERCHRAIVAARLAARLGCPVTHLAAIPTLL